MIFVAPGTRDYVNGSARGDSRGDIEVHGRELELLHLLLREIHRGHATAHINAIGDVTAVNGRQGPVAAAKHADREQDVELRDRSIRDRDTGLELRELQVVASVQ